MVYAPIQELTPSQVGTIIDEKVDIHDVVAEIVELARLKYLAIHKLETKKLLGKSIEYAFIKLNEGTEKLEAYQQYLLDELFSISRVSKSQLGFKKLSKSIQQQLTAELNKQKDPEYVLLSALKQDFYKNLDEFRNQLYENMKDKSYYSGNPEKTRGKWIGIYFAILIGLGTVSVLIAVNVYNFIPMFLLAGLSLPGFIFAYQMPRRTAWGYSLYRQITGLRYFIDKGKWREQIAEKHLFLEETLPLAISLGVVNQLAKDMAELGVKPPEYLQGFTAASLASDFGHFTTQTSSTLASAPTSSGRSSWSGGSGFSSGGGFSGGGFGGGGGRSW